MKSVALPDGERVPALGLGTWNMGDRPAQRSTELAALRYGLDHGATLLDTAEMYGDGRSESLVAEALAGRRDEAFVVSKVLPSNATRRGTIAACERSLKRLATDRIDLYLLHWSGGVPFAETLEAFARLKAEGKIRHFGVSNLDLGEIQAFLAAPGGAGTATNQLLYNLGRRGIEWDLLPWLAAHRIPVMAYSPLEQARLSQHKALAAFAKGLGVTASQVALAWLLAKDNVIAIPKSGDAARVAENLAAANLALTAGQLAQLDALFPPPAGPRPLEML